jgi:hypothetical protein
MHELLSVLIVATSKRRFEICLAFALCSNGIIGFRSKRIILCAELKHGSERKRERKFI